VIVFARDKEFAGRKLRSQDGAIEIRSLEISLPVAEIYHGASLTAYP
jgi:hypothetical protein